jgi:sugar/nucleoside kinase (ribokinase family)
VTGPSGLFVGLATLDVIQRVERPPGPDEKVIAKRADIAAGGPATGAALAFAALGGRATLLSSLGSGLLAGLVRDDLERHRVKVVDQARGTTDVAVSAVAIIDATGERSVVSRNAEDVEVSAPDDLEHRVDEADVVLVDGHHPQLALMAANHARACGVTVVLDAGSWKPVLTELLPLTTMAVCSSAFRLPGGKPSPASLIEQGPEFVAVTDGPNAVRWYTRRRSGVVPVPTVTVRDSLGAGDTFHGAFAHALALGATPEDALRSAVEIASIRVTYVGPRSWMSDPRLTTTTPPGAEAR